MYCTPVIQLTQNWQVSDCLRGFHLCTFVHLHLYFCTFAFANAFLKNQMNTEERKIHGTVNLLYPFKPAFSKRLDYLQQSHN